jgi:PAS domain S-box-containing protein
VRERLRRTADAIYARPVRAVLLGGALTVGVLLGVAGGAWSLYRSQGAAQETAFRMQFLLSRVAVLDEIATRSARMAAVGGNPVWQEQYYDVSPALRAAAEELADEADALGQRPIALQLRDAERQMVQIEDEVFDLVAQNEQASALHLLSTQEYNAQKEIVSRAIADLSSAVEDHLRAHSRSAQRLALWSGLLGTFGVLALLLIWTLVLALLRRHLVERRRAEAELSAEHAFTRAVIDSSPNGVFVKDAEGRFVLVNRVIADFYNLTPEAILAKDPLDLALAPEQAERFRRADQQVLETGQSVLLPAAPVTRPGTDEIRWFETRKVPLQTPNGRLQVLTIASDVTARAEAESALRANEERLQALIRASPLSIEALDAEGLVTLWNPAAEQTFGWTYQEIVGRPNPLVPEGGMEEHLALRSRTFAGESFTGIMVQRQRKDGTIVDVRLSTAPLRDADGVVRGAMAVLEDITEQKRLQGRLRESERRLSTLIDNLPGVVYRSRNDRNWTFEYIGGRTVELFGYPPEELVGEGAVSLAELIHPEDREKVWGAVQEGLAARQPFQLEYRIHTTRGEEKCVWEQGEGVFSPEGKLMALEGFITDVTAIKWAEERDRQLALEQSAREHAEAAEERIRGILESITDAFFAVDENWCFTYVNAHIEALTGRSREELLGRNLWELFPTPPANRGRIELHRVMEQKVPTEFEAYGANTGIWAQVRAYPHEGGLAAFVRDITDRKQAESTSDLEQRRLRAVLDCLPVGVFVADVNGKIIRTNAASERIWGTSDLPHPEYPEEYREYRGWWPETGKRLEPHEWGLARALSGESSDGQEVLINTFDGSRKTILNHARPIYDATGEQVGAVVAVVDITERKRMEDALVESERRFRLMVERVRDYAIVFLDPAGHVVRWNPGAKRVKGYEEGEILGQHFSIFYPEEERARGTPGHLLDLAADQGSAEDEGWRLRMDGTRFWASVMITALKDEAGELLGYAMITRDLTERHQRELELQAAKEAAEAASRAKSEMLSRTSHELRTPMNSILGFAQILEKDVERADDKESVEQILRAGRHLLVLIDEVLDIGRAESGQMALPLCSVHVREVVKEALSILRPLAERMRVQLPQDRLASCNVQVSANRQRLKQVLLNLIANAIKYNREGGWVEVNCARDEQDHIRISVRDSGPGISPERLSLLFQPFERAGAERSQVQGTGLGLALSKALTGAMGGLIGAQSVPGEGSTFWVELPEFANSAQAAGHEADEASPRRTSGAADVSAVVLYVDDELNNLRLMERIFTRNRPGVELIQAMEGQRGLEIARDRTPDLILLDLNLPDISGEEVLRRLRQEPNTYATPVIAISGDANPEQIRRLREQGAFEYFTKPFEVEEFLQAVQEALTREQA